MKIPHDYTAVCTKCYKKTRHTDTTEKHYNCWWELKIIDTSDLPIQDFKLGERYNFIDKEGNKKRFTVGITSWWKPCLLLLHNARSIWSSNLLTAKDIVEYDYKQQAYILNTYIL